MVARSLGCSRRRDDALPIAGVGLTYVPGLEPLIDEEGDALQVLEVEPKTLWLRSPHGSRYRVEKARFNYVRGLPGTKVLHGVGFPVGGYHRADEEQLPVLHEMIEALKPPWISEHLAFNRAAGPSGVFQTGFLLPPLQTPDGIRAAVSSLQWFAKQLPIPLAIEHGVSYLRPLEGELSDGAFFRAVVEGAGCGIVLDLHNAWTNARNGRQSVEEFLQCVPLDGVWEVHLAGGTEYAGYWLDAHSGEIPIPVIDLAREVIPELPNLKALVFEILPVYLEIVGLPKVRNQLEQLRRLWELRGKRARTYDSEIALEGARHVRSTKIGPELWENTLGALVVGQSDDTPLARHLAVDPGLRRAGELSIVSAVGLRREDRLTP